MFLTIEDLAPFAEIDKAKAGALIADVEAEAKQIAPCLSGGAVLTSDQLAYVRAILRQIVLRRNDVGSGARSSTTHQAGPISVTESMDTRNGRTGSFTRDEREALENLCRQLSNLTDLSGKAFEVAPERGIATGIHPHMPWCSLAFGAAYCSCGVDLTAGRYPLFEGGELS